jgi:hypothetical protein
VHGFVAASPSFLKGIGVEVGMKERGNDGRYGKEWKEGRGGNSWQVEGDLRRHATQLA